MPILSDQQITELAYNAGFRGEALRWAVAIAKAESGGNPSAYNPEAAAGTAPNAGSRGLWQIYGTAHPQYNSSIAFDPAVNARAAFEVYREAGNRFTPWSTFNNGMASQYVNGLKIKQPTNNNRPSTPAARGGVSGTGSASGGLPAVVQDAQNTTQALSDIASGKFIENIFSKVDKVSLGFYIGGLVLILVGLAVLFAKPAAQLVVTGTKIASVL